MKKCISCKAELPTQAHFCGKCGTRQPIEKGIDEIGNDYAIRNPMAYVNNTLLSIPPISSPPALSKEEKENENTILEFSPPQFSENKQGDIGPTALPESQLHAPHSQPQQLHGEHLQPQQYYSPHQQPQQFHGPHQQSYHHYQQPPNPMMQTATAAKVGTTVTKTGSASVGKWVLITVIAATVLGASGVGVALAFHPFHLFITQPVMKVASKYNAQGKPIAANGTTLHVSGQQFAANSPITFLLDNKPLNETQRTQSDGNGNVTTDLAVTSAWNVGRHTLTAHDANNTTTSAIAINIVQPGQDSTPGPNGAPSDDASFTIQLNVQATNDNGQSYSYTYKLIITGHPDPTGGTVCASEDNGTPISDRGIFYNNTNVTYNRTRTYSCSGTYKGGTVSYSQTLQTETTTASNGENCHLNSPQQLYLHITGSYTDQHNFSGSAVYTPMASSAYTCTPAGSTYWNLGSKGNWTGTVSQS